MAKGTEMLQHGVKLSYEISAEEFNKELQSAYVKTRGRYACPGFRKGKAPRRVIENYYGEGTFYESAFDSIYEAQVISDITAGEYKVLRQPDIDIQKMSKEDGLEFTVTVWFVPEITLGEYKGIELNASEYTISDEETEVRLNIRIEEQRNELAREISITDRAVKNGDIVVIDYSGSIDDEKFEGGTAENQRLEIGSGTFIPGFEEQIIGMNINDEKDIKVTFPEKYHAEELAGKEAVFAIKLHEIIEKELPELDDEFVKDISEFNTVEEYKADLIEKVKKELEKEAENRMHNDAMKIAIERCDMKYPYVFVEEEAAEIAMQGVRQMGLDISFDQYVQAIGGDREEILSRFTEEAKIRVESELFLSKLIEAENITLSDEEVDARIKEMIDGYSTGEEFTEERKQELFDSIAKDVERKEYFKRTLIMEKAQKLVIDSIVIK